MLFSDLGAEVERLAECAPNLLELQRAVVGLIAQNLSRYNWVGFYMLDPEDASTLVLGPFHGQPTDHVRILVTEGICGAAVARGKTVVVDDVSADPRYLACSVDTKSEIVAPIWVRGQAVGEIDVDSHTPVAFGPADREFLERCAQIVGRYMERSDDRPTPFRSNE